jgi:acylphosphatase
MTLKRVHVLVRGRVQNVGFRAFALRHAQESGLNGWVRNLPNEQQLEMEVQGDEDAVTKLVALLRYGPVGARVKDMQVEPRTVTVQERSGFRVL